MFTCFWELGARNDVLLSRDHTRGFEVPSLNGRAVLNVDSLYTVNLSVSDSAFLIGPPPPREQPIPLRQGFLSVGGPQVALKLTGGQMTPWEAIHPK